MKPSARRTRRLTCYAWWLLEAALVPLREVVPLAGGTIALLDDDELAVQTVVGQVPGPLRERLALVVETNGLCVVEADAARLEQVMNNLVDNAAKYSPLGGTIRVAVAGEDGGVHVAVRDEGIGLPAGQEEVIFAPFGRASNATERHIPGMGMGLHICREIMTRHGGRIWAESPGEGQGTTFHLWLPLVEASAQAEATERGTPKAAAASTRESRTMKSQPIA